jgi:hypothetical protein
VTAAGAGVARRLGAALLWLCAAAAGANDRPFLAASSAAAEEDDDAVWSVEGTYQRLGAVRSQSLAAEYAFDPVNSLQIELARSRDRASQATDLATGVEYKHLFNHIARDGYGWGVIVGLEFARPQAAGWTADAWSLVLPCSLQIGAAQGLLHASVGIIEPRDEPRRWTAALAYEHEVARRTRLFAEVARDADAHLVHGGVRYWALREKLALDLSVQRSWVDGTRRNGFVVGIGFYDL